MKIVWLCPYPIKVLLPQLRTTGRISEHASSWILNLSDELKNQNNIDLHIITDTSKIPFSQNINKNDIKYHIIKYGVPFTNRGFPRYFPMNKLTWYSGFRTKAISIIEKISPDVVHAHGTEKGYAITAVECGFPCIISIQGIIREIFKVSPSVGYFLQIPIEKYAIRYGKSFGCRTKWDKKFVSKLNSKAKIYYSPEAIGYEFYDKQWRIVKDNSVIYVGSLEKRKGIEILIRAIAIVKNRFTNIQLNIVGSGSRKYVKHLKELVHKLNIVENVAFIGYINSKGIASLLSVSKIFVLPTYIDNSPNSLAEAMAVGTPCIASRAGGISSMIEDGINGILVEKGRADILATKLNMLLLDKKLLETLSMNAKEIALKRNHRQLVAEVLLETYDNIKMQHI